MNTKKIFSVILTGLLASSMLIGCKSDNSSSSNKSSSDGTGTSAGSGDSSKSVMPKAGTSFKLWIAMKPAIAKEFVDINDAPYSKVLEEKTGCKVDYVSPAQGQEKQQFNLLMATPDELPDVIAYDIEGAYPGGVAAAIEDGVIIDATDLIKKYAPDFMKYVNQDKNMQKDAYSDNGSITAFGKTVVGEGMRGLPFTGMMLNKNYFEAAKIDTPVTLDDWENMLRKFKEQGVAEPFSFACNNVFQQNSLNDAFSSAYGVTGGPRFYQEKGTVKYGPVEEGYKQWIELFRKWYADGLIDPDFVSKNSNKDTTKEYQNGKIGATCKHVSSLLQSTDPAAQKVAGIPVAAPVLKKGDVINLRASTENYTGSPFYITTKAKNPEEIVKWINYMYSDEGFVTCNWGIKDSKNFEDTYKENSDGSREYVGKAAEYMKDNKAAFVTANEMVLYWNWDFQRSQYYNDELEQQAFKIWSTATNDNAMPKALALTADESAEFTNLKTDVDVYVIENTAKFIMGKQSMDKYDDYLKTLKQMGVDKMIKIQQTALDRYNKRA